MRLTPSYLQNIFQYLDSAIMVVDEDEKFVAWNNGAEKLFGFSQAEIIGKKSTALLPEGDKYRIELQEIINEVRSKGFAKLIETERKTKDNRVLPVQLNVAKLPGENNEYLGRTIVITDVTEVRKLQQQVDQSEKLAVIGQLAAGVAHEIGNPLASISSIVQILQRKSKDQFMSDQLINVKDNINRISKIVRELVDLSRPPSHDSLLTQINEVVKTAVGIVKYDKRVKKVEFKTNLNEKLPMIEIVPDQLLQVFINILINSLDAIQGEGTIKVKSQFDEKNIYIDISDNGIGIENEILEKIFDPFFTTKQVGKGTGLGLSVSYGIIKKFNGEIKVKSTVNEGSEFNIQLPIKLEL
ncbi:MAG: PAS domain S-box protein [Ignavibacteriales bacterium]|nr:PAS domain S-box protein [Ignavibacteriales bacterium]MCB9209298.1 PAS domain S-box protein [Ignavibacteriales bacterium]MCB9257942.1 PAS domain S-box protein [Ignavibacteriales bacterium]